MVLEIINQVEMPDLFFNIIYTQMMRGEKVSEYKYW